MGKKSGGSTQTYTPTEDEKRMQKISADYAEAVDPNARWLNTTARNLLEDSMGTVQVDFGALNQSAQNQIGQAQQGIAGLTAGGMEGFNQNMEAALKSGVNNVMGSTLTDWAEKGIINSSQSEKDMSNLSKNVSDTMAQQYSNNVSTLNGLYGQQAALANAGITTAAGAQEASQSPALSLWNASLGLNGATTSTLGAIAGQGTTTTTTSGGGSGILGGLFGLGSAAITACFTKDTEITLSNGAKAPIEAVKVGDQLKCYDRVKQEETVEDVIAVEENDVEQPIIKIMLKDDGGNTVILKTTLSQPLLREDGKFEDVGIMKIGTRLYGGYTVKDFSKSTYEKVYDIKTNGCNCYFAEGIVAYGVF